MGRQLCFIDIPDDALCGVRWQDMIDTLRTIFAVSMRYIGEIQASA